MLLIGEATVNLQLGSICSLKSFPVVSNLKGDCLIGRDILSSHVETKEIYTKLENVINKMSLNINDYYEPTENDSFNIFSFSINEKEEDPEEKARTKLEAEIKKLCEQISVAKLSQLTQANKVEHVIKLTDNTPIRQKERQIPFYKQQELRDMLREMLEAGIIQKSNSPYRSPIRLVGKPDGSLRITIDFKKLNDKTIKDAYSVPDTWITINKLSQAKYFTKLDQDTTKLNNIQIVDHIQLLLLKTVFMNFVQCQWD
jgi:hypothetical protein